MIASLVSACEAGRQAGRQVSVRLECIDINVDTSSTMDLQIAKWGNSLALRIPSSLVHELGLRNGGTVHAQVTADGTLAIRPAGWSRTVFAAELEQARSRLPMGASVVDEMRQAARY